jgi:hypothetical protein
VSEQASNSQDLTVALVHGAFAEGSHVIMVSQPQLVADVILTAAAAVDQPAAAPAG